MRKCDFLNSETGGVTILVALMLLLLLTVSAISMSRNSLREVILSGTIRQGVEARNLADNGIEWSCYWVTPSTTGLSKATPEAGAIALGAPIKELSGNKELWGEARTVAATGAVMSATETNGPTRSYSLSVILMGKQQLDLTGGAPSTGAGAETKAIPTELLPDIWSIRSTGKLDYGISGVAFQHVREAWITAPPQGQ